MIILNCGCQSLSSESSGSWYCPLTDIVMMSFTRSFFFLGSLSRSVLTAPISDSFHSSSLVWKRRNEEVTVIRLTHAQWKQQTMALYHIALIFRGSKFSRIAIFDNFVEKISWIHYRSRGWCDVSKFSLKYFREWHRIRENRENLDPQNISVYGISITRTHTGENLHTYCLV